MFLQLETCSLIVQILDFATMSVLTTGGLMTQRSQVPVQLTHLGEIFGDR